MCNDRNALTHLNLPLSLSLPGFSPSVFEADAGLKNRHTLHHYEKSEIEGERLKEKRDEFEEEKVGCERRRGSSLKRLKHG